MPVKDKIFTTPPLNFIPTRGQYEMDFSLNCDLLKLLNFDHTV